MQTRRFASGLWAGTRFLSDFTVRQALSCAFPIGIMLAMGATKLLPPMGIARYDLMFVVCITFQWIFLRLKWETWREIGILAIFHVVGVILEWYKVQAGSWAYPEPAVLKINGVPLFSGFMYASVASYMSQSWRRLELEFHRWPSLASIVVVLTLAYGQFFLPVQTVGIRLASLLFVLFVFRQTRVGFTVDRKRFVMPLPASFLLIGSCIYVAENVATYFGVWAYPNQVGGWEPVSVTKVISWSLLMVVSLNIVYVYHKRFMGVPLTDKHVKTWA